MLRLFATIKKEMLLLIRDKSGLAILFLMPMVLVTLMALIQDGPFRDYQELKIPLILINNDHGDLGKEIVKGLNSSKIFNVTLFTGTATEARRQVDNGDFQIGIIIPPDASQKLKTRVDQQVNETMKSMGIAEPDSMTPDTVASVTSIPVFFSPDIKKSFKNSVLSSITHVSSMYETQKMVSAFKKAVNDEYVDSVESPIRSFIQFEDIGVSTRSLPYELNSVQHNVPAWTLFSMFFIVISLAGSMIRERHDGSYVRVLTMPGSYVTVMAGKVISYLVVCLMQCALLILTGMFLLPGLGLPQLVIGNNFPAILVVALCSGLSAVGFGVLVGTVFNTQQQSSTFGAVSVIILAALGGIWVPVFVMPEIIRMLATLSPLYWGLNAFQSVFLGTGNLTDIWLPSVKLLLFCIFTLSIAYFVNKIKD